MPEPSERYLALARSIIRETQEECGLFHVHAVGKIRDSLVECRREAIEECAVLLPALRRLVEEWPDVTPATWDIAQALLAKVALADHSAPAAPPEPTEAEVEAATEVYWNPPPSTHSGKEHVALMLAAAAKVRAR
jgi:hypothetical protein